MLSSTMVTTAGATISQPSRRWRAARLPRRAASLAAAVGVDVDALTNAASWTAGLSQRRPFYCAECGQDSRPVQHCRLSERRGAYTPPLRPAPTASHGAGRGE